MKNYVEEFLLAYKAFETQCRTLGKEVKDLEEELGETDPKMQKLRMCRQIRNYVSHNDYTDFIQIHKGMIKFLKDELKASKQKPKKTKKTTTIKKKK